MGQVYLARHRITGKRVALKMLVAGLDRSAQAGKRLVREAVASGCIEHRHVVNVFDIGEHAGAHFLVMEYLEGKSFQRLLNERQCSDRQLLEILMRAMDGVRAAHARRVIHRDLKPDNILVCQGPTGLYDDPKVVDFGICRLAAANGDADLTQAGITVGSPFYMSLEQLQGARDLDGRADLYALGVIVYQALTSRRPFEAESLGELTERVASGSPPPALSELRPDLPRGLSRVVMRALSRDREHRQADVTTLIAELEPFVSRLSDTVPAARRRRGSGARPAGRTPVPSFRRERARPWLELAVAAVAAFGFTLGGITLLRPLTTRSHRVMAPAAGRTQDRHGSPGLSSKSVASAPIAPATVAGDAALVSASAAPSEQAPPPHSPRGPGQSPSAPPLGWDLHTAAIEVSPTAPARNPLR